MKIKYTSDNYEKLFNLFLGDLGLELKEEQNLLGQIQKDVARNLFVSTNDKGVENFEKVLFKDKEQLQDDVSPYYSQGDLTGDLFSNILFQNSFFSSLSEPELWESREVLPFSYFNDDGTLCGFSINFLIGAPDRWCLSVIENPIAAPEKRAVHIFTSEENIKIDNEIFQDTFKDSLKAALSSDFLFKLVGNLFQNDGEVNPDVFNKLQMLAFDNSTHINTRLKFKEEALIPPALMRDTILSMLNRKGLSVCLKKKMHSNSQNIFLAEAGNNKAKFAYFPLSVDVNMPDEHANFSDQCQLGLFNGLSSEKQIDLIPLLSQFNKANDLVDKGYTCILPILRITPYEFRGSKTILNQAKAFFSNAVPETSKVITALRDLLKQDPLTTDTTPEIQNCNWALILWNKNTIKFFDPKSTVAWKGLMKKSNSLIKDFFKNAGYDRDEQYKKHKEDHPTDHNEGNNSAYYVIKRISVAVDGLVDGENNMQPVSFPSEANVRQEGARELFHAILTPDVLDHVLKKNDSEKQQQESQATTTSLRS